MRRHRERDSSPFRDNQPRPRKRAWWVATCGMAVRASVAALLAAVVLAVLAACSGRASSAPSAVPLPLRPGRQLLTLAGFASSADPAFPPCTPAGQPRDGTSVATVVMLEKQGDEWVARSEPTAGSIELHLRGTRLSGATSIVSGTIAGSAVDLGVMGVVRDVRVTLASSSGAGLAAFDGEASPSSFVAGRVTGALKFSDSQGLSSTCPAIQWSMQPM
jgi:hypothetical protein